jgi:hypothetical protein
MRGGWGGLFVSGLRPHGPLTDPCGIAGEKEGGGVGGGGRRGGGGMPSARFHPFTHPGAGGGGGGGVEINPKKNPP